MKKRLLLIVPSLMQGGFERVCVESVRIMRDDFEVFLMIFDSNNAHYDVGGINLINIDLPAVPGKICKILNLLRRIIKIKSIKRKYSIDISYSFGSTANLANSLSRVKDRIVTSMRSSLDLDSVGRMKKILRGSDLMISCSKQMEDILNEKFGFTKTAVLYNPVDIENIKKNSDKFDPHDIDKEAQFEGCNISGSGFTIAAMGRDDNAKGYWHLIKAVSLLKNKYPEIKLFIIGSGKFEREKKLIKELELENEVILTGVKKNPFPYLNMADLFVLPSNREGFPNVLVEAMSLSIPVIASDCVSGPAEILYSDDEYKNIRGLKSNKAEHRSVTEIHDAEYGVLTPDMCADPDYDANNISGDDVMLSKAIDGMLADRKRLGHYSKKSFERASMFSRDRYREELRTILNEALKTKHRK